MVEQFLAITLGMADIMMVSTLGESAVSGVSLVDTLFIFINQLFAALATGGAVVCSQFIGRKQPERAGAAAKQLILVVVASSFFFSLVCFPFRSGILRLIFGSIENDVLLNADTYFMWMLVGLPAVALYNACAALFRSQGNSRVAMWTGLLINVVNIGGNAIMLYGMHSGTEGVAIPTFVSRTLASVVMLVLLRKPGYSKQISILGLSKTSLELPLIKKILQIGVPNGLENSVFQLGKILVITLVAEFGTGAIAANAASNTVASFEVLPAASVGLALLTIVGQCMGAGRSDEAEYFTKRLMLIGYAGTILLNLPLLLFSKHLVSFYNMSPDTAHLAWQMLMCHGINCMVFWPSSFALPNALRASNDAKFTMIVSFISMWTVRIGLSYVFAKFCGFGALGTWYAMMCDWVVRSICFVLRLKSGKWKKRSLL